MIAAILGIFNTLADILNSVLPASPFQDLTLPNTVLTGLGWLNWVLPIGDMLTLMGVVLALLIVARVAMFVIDSGIDLTKLATGSN